MATGGRKTAEADVAPDNRLPTAGDAIVRSYKGRQVRVVVLANGFEYEGRRDNSLSAVAKAVSGAHCKGLDHVGLLVDRPTGTAGLPFT